MSRRRRNTKPSPIKPIYLLLGALAIWFMASVGFSKSPTVLLSDGFKKITGDTENITLTHKEWIAKSEALRDSLQESQNALLDCKNYMPYPKGKISFDGRSVNLREEAALTGTIITQIPVDAEVYIISYDERELFLSGEKGQWCFVKYGVHEGWIWGNFIEKK